MKVLVTGGAGLVGHHTAKFYLDRGDEVYIIDNLARSYLLRHDVSDARKHFNIKLSQAAGAHWICQSIGDPTAFASLPDDIELIVHLAAQTSVPTSIANPREDFMVNAIGSFDVMEFARKTGAAVVYASTNKTYPLHAGWEKYLLPSKKTMRWDWSDPDWYQNGFPVDGHHAHPEWSVGSRTPYGQSKYVGDLLCQEYHHTYGLRTGVFRMSCIADTNQFSFSEQGWLVHFIIQNLKNQPITVFGDGCQVRDILAARDLVKAYNGFFESKLQHAVFNIGGGPVNSLSLNEAIQEIEEVTGNKVPVKYEDWRPLDQRVYTSDIRPLKDKLGWEPKISPRQIVEDAVKWVETNIEVF